MFKYRLVLCTTEAVAHCMKHILCPVAPAIITAHSFLHRRCPGCAADGGRCDGYSMRLRSGRGINFCIAEPIAERCMSMKS